jgi:hypothetical protein
MFGRKSANAQPPAPAWQPLPQGVVRDPEAMEDEPSQIWGPDDDE